MKGPLLPPPPRQALLLKADPQVLLTDLLSCATSWDLPPLCRRKHLPSALLEGRTKGSHVINLAQGCTGCEQNNWRRKPGFMPPGLQLNKQALHSFPKFSQDPTTIELRSNSEEDISTENLELGNEQPEVVPFITATERGTTLNKPLQCEYVCHYDDRACEGLCSLGKPLHTSRV